MAKPHKWFNTNSLAQLTSSGKQTVSGAIKVTAGVFGGVVVQTDGSSAGTVTLYDHATTAAGTVLFAAVVPASDRYGGFAPPFVIHYSNGCYLELSGTSATAIVYYD